MAMNTKLLKIKELTDKLASQGKLNNSLSQWGVIVLKQVEQGDPNADYSLSMLIATLEAELIRIEDEEDYQTWASSHDNSSLAPWLVTKKTYKTIKS